MEKSIILKFSGDLESGFEVIVEVVNLSGQESRSEGYLPACPILEDKYQQWQSSLQALAKIKNPQSVATKNVTIFEKIQGLRQSREETKYRYREAEKSLVEMMNSWLKSESFMPIREILDRQISDSEKGRLIVRTSNLQLKKLPWETWEWLNSGNRKVTVSYSSINFVSPPHVRHKFIRIIAVIGHASNLNVQEDLRFLGDRLPPHAILEPLINQSRQQLLSYLNKNSADIFYFGGHSKTEGDRGRIWINENEYLEIEDLKNTLKKMRLEGLKLAVFNSCDGLGLANNLDEKNLSIPNLIVMRDAIHDRVAHRFLQELVAEFISEKLPLHQAVQKARDSLAVLEDDFPGSSLQPILISGATQDQTYQSWLEKPVTQNQAFKLFINSLTIALVITMLKALGWLESWEWQAYDLMLKFQKNEQLTPKLLVVDVTQADINALQGEYPLKNQTLLRSLQNLNKHKPSAIGIDIFRYPPLDPAPKAQIEYQNLIKYWQDNPHIVPICSHSETHLKDKSLAIELGTMGFADIAVDGDEIIRRSLIAVEPPVQSPCQASYSLGANLALTYLQSKGYKIRFLNDGIWEIYNLEKQKVVRWEALQPYTSFYSRAKTTSGYQMLLNYRHTDSVAEISQRVTLTDVLKENISPQKIRDRIILIGMTDPNVAKDEFKTPYDIEIRGLWLHAHMVSQLVDSVEDGRPLLKFLNWKLQILLVWVLSLTTSFLTWRFKYLTSLKITGAIVVLIYTISLGVFLSQGLIIPIIPAVLALVMTLLAGLISTVIFLQRDSSQADTL